MKICMVSNANESYPYGSTTRPHYFAKYLSRDGFEILHVCIKGSSAGGAIEYLCLGEHSEKSESELLNIIISHCAKFSPDIIYSHQVYTASIALKLKRLFNIPHVYDPHGSVALESSLHSQQSLMRRETLIATEKAITNFTQKIIAPSPELRDYLSITYRLPHSKFAIIKNGVETDIFEPTPPDINLRNSLGIPSEATLIVFTNPRVFSSNEIALRYFFRLLPDIERRCRNPFFLILGGGPKLEAPSDRVIYTGFVEDLPTYVNLADVCVAPFPSNAICGGTRNKICEYLACGKPIVSTIEGMRGFDDAIHGEHFLCAASSADFVSQIAYCTNNSEQSARLGRNARRLSKKYDWNRLSSALGEVLEQYNTSRDAMRSYR